MKRQGNDTEKINMLDTLYDGLMEKMNADFVPPPLHNLNKLISHQNKKWDKIKNDLQEKNQSELYIKSTYEQWIRDEIDKAKRSMQKHPLNSNARIVLSHYIDSRQKELSSPLFTHRVKALATIFMVEAGIIEHPTRETQREAGGKAREKAFDSLHIKSSKYKEPVKGEIELVIEYLKLYHPNHIEAIKLAENKLK